MPDNNFSNTEMPLPNDQVTLASSTGSETAVVRSSRASTRNKIHAINRHAMGFLMELLMSRRRPASASLPQSSHDRLTALPPELRHHILGFLDIQSAARMSQVSRVWHEDANDTILWRYLQRAYLPSLTPQQEWDSYEINRGAQYKTHIRAQSDAFQTNNVAAQFPGHLVRLLGGKRQFFLNIPHLDLQPFNFPETEYIDFLDPGHLSHPIMYGFHCNRPFISFLLSISHRGNQNIEVYTLHQRYVGATAQARNSWVEALGGGIHVFTRDNFFLQPEKNSSRVYQDIATLLRGETISFNHVLINNPVQVSLARPAPALRLRPA